MIKTILMFFYIAIVMILLIPIGIVPMILYILGLRKSMSKIIYRLGQLWAYSITALSGAKVTVNGRENIPKKGGVCFVSNHCGYFDIVIMLAYSGRQFGFVAKKELLLIPFLIFGFLYLEVCS